jgi:hypothetical protein
MKKLACVALLFLACNTPPPPHEARVAIPAVPPAPPATTVPPPARAKSIAYLAVMPDWVAPYVVIDEAAMRAWAADPANAKRMAPPVRHVLVKSDKDEAAAKKKAEAILARAKKGEDFAKLARESDDPGSSHSGGMYAGRMVENFIDEFRVAYDALAPGQLRPTLLQTQFGFHVLKKDPIDTATMREGYTRFRAAELAHAIADEMAEMIDARGATDRVLVARLGVKAADDAQRPVARAMPSQGADADPSCSELERRVTETGKVVVVPIGNGEGWLIAKPLDEDVEPDVETSFCAAEGAHAATRKMMRDVMKRLREQQDAGGN